jgi:N-methylhydantoinase A/oxoprolinase/acetone carboxylase beta subunit
MPDENLLLLIACDKRLQQLNVFGPAGPIHACKLQDFLGRELDLEHWTPHPSFSVLAFRHSVILEDAYSLSEGLAAAHHYAQVRVGEKQGALARTNAVSCS